MKISGFFKEDNGNFSQARLQMFMAFIVAILYLGYCTLKTVPIDVAIFYGLLVYSASIKLFQKFMEEKTPKTE